MLLFVFTLSNFVIFVDTVSAKCTYVKGHYRNGKYVSGYYRGCGGGSDSDYTPSYPSSSDSDYTPSYPTYTPKPSYNDSKRIVNLYKGNTYVGSTDASKLVSVRGYYRKDGTYVRPHYRTHPNGFIDDNFSEQGLSTLLPLSKNKISFSSQPNIARAERYLYSVVGGTSLSSGQVEGLKQYATSLETNRKYPNSVREQGEFFYHSLQYHPFLAKAQATFDLTGNQTPESYLTQLLIQFGKTSLTDEQEQLLERYALALKSNQGTYTIGKDFYRSLELDINIEDQIDMDSMQQNDKWTKAKLENIVENMKGFVVLEKQVKGKDNSVLPYMTDLYILRFTGDEETFSIFKNLSIPEKKLFLYELAEPFITDIFNQSLVYFTYKDEAYGYIETTYAISKPVFGNGEPTLENYFFPENGGYQVPLFKNIEDQEALKQIWDSMKVVKLVQQKDKPNYGLKSSYDVALLLTFTTEEEWQTYNSLPDAHKKRLISHTVYREIYSKYWNQFFDSYVFVMKGKQVFTSAKVKLSIIADGGTSEVIQFTHDPKGKITMKIK